MVAVPDLRDEMVDSDQARSSGDTEWVCSRWNRRRYEVLEK
jgi:hypothetical protein